ncbi:hypothetical protein PINS_up000847 [Pythium insidiosum]|nr:hypothetical protein PINS_up000847 [Pythium insidiosum]
MTISKRVQQQYFVQSPTAATPSDAALIRIPPTIVVQPESLDAAHRPVDPRRPQRRTNVWTTSEHERFLEALEQFPSGPWKRIAAHVGTKTTRQTMTHAQKYREKIARWTRSNRQGVAAALSLSTPGAFLSQFDDEYDQAPEPALSELVLPDAGAAVAEAAVTAGAVGDDAPAEPTPFLDGIIDSMVGDWTADEFESWLRDLDAIASAPS